MASCKVRAASAATATPTAAPPDLRARGSPRRCPGHRVPPFRRARARFFPGGWMRRSHRRRGPDDARCALRSDLHEEVFVKTGARRLRDFPDIHSASAAAAARHESVCGCPHSHQRRRSAPCRTPGCNLSPALDLDVEPSSDRSTAPGTVRGNREEASGGPGGGNEPPVAGTDAAKSRQEVRRAVAWLRHPAHADSINDSPPASPSIAPPQFASGQPREPEFGSLASAGFSCHSVPRRSMAHITRTR